MAGYILKYTSGTYQRKINALNNYYSQLSTHLDTLNELKDKMKDFWDGSDASAKYIQIIGDKINEVKKAMDDCKNTNIQYQEVVDDMTNASSVVDSAVEDAKAASSELTETASTAASIASLII